MSGPPTLDPHTLHIDSAGTTATIRGSKRKAWGAAGRWAHIGSSLLCCHDEVTAVKVKAVGV